MPKTSSYSRHSTETALAQSNLRRRVLNPVAEEIGTPWCGFHTFRHTCASMLFERGDNAKKVQKWLGHHSPSFTLATYVHLLDEHLSEPLVLGGSSETRRTLTPQGGQAP